MSNAVGRAASALQAVAAMDYLFHVQNVVVVHHSFCGITAFTPGHLIEKFRDDHGVDLSTLFDHESLAIMDYKQSSKHDVALLRASPAVPRHVRLCGFFYEISFGELTEVVRDIPG